jgi:hypothetical protein
MGQTVYALQVRNSRFDDRRTALDIMNDFALSTEGAVRINLTRCVFEFDPCTLLLKQICPTPLVVY